MLNISFTANRTFICLTANYLCVYFKRELFLREFKQKHEIPFTKKKKTIAVFLDFGIVPPVSDTVLRKSESVS